MVKYFCGVCGQEIKLERVAQALASGQVPVACGPSHKAVLRDRRVRARKKVR